MLRFHSSMIAIVCLATLACGRDKTITGPKPPLPPQDTVTKYPVTDPIDWSTQTGTVQITQGAPTLGALQMLNSNRLVVNEINTTRIWQISKSSTKDGVDQFTASEVSRYSNPACNAGSMAFSANGTIFRCRGDRQIEMVSGTSPVIFNELDNTFQCSITALGASTDGKYVVGGDRCGRWYMFDSNTRGVVLKNAPADTIGPITAIALSDKYIALASKPNATTYRVVLIDRTTGATVRAPFNGMLGHSAPINAMVWNHAGTTLATAGQDRQLKTWEVSNGLLVERCNLPLQDEGMSVAFTVTDTLVAVGTRDGRRNVYGYSTAVCHLHFASAPTGTPIMGLAFSEQRMLSLDNNGRLTFWLTRK